MTCCNTPYAANACAAHCGDVCGGDGFSCIINLIIILIVLQFLTQIICGLQCDAC